MTEKKRFRLDQSRINPQLRLLPFWGGEFSSFKDRLEIRPKSSLY